MTERTIIGMGFHDNADRYRMAGLTAAVGGSADHGIMGVGRMAAEIGIAINVTVNTTTWLEDGMVEGASFQGAIGDHIHMTSAAIVIVNT